MRRTDFLQEMPPPFADIEQAFGFIVEKRQLRTDAILGCTSYVQRKLQTSYAHAAILLDEMVRRGWITGVDDRGARRIVRQPFAAANKETTCPKPTQTS